MGSSEGLASVELYSFRQNFNIDSWLNSDYFSHDSDLFTKALHKSISTTDSPLSPSTYFDSTLPLSNLSPPQTLSNVSFGSDPDISIAGSSKRKRGGGCGGSGLGVSSNGKPTKRRSRVSTKKSQTTFITADAANFRQMVQQVTGAKFINGSFSPIVKPEPQRLSSRLPPSSGTLDRSSVVPTLDTSSFLSNHHQTSVSPPFHQSSTVVTTNVGGAGSAVELSNYSSFPTLESWKVM